MDNLSTECCGQWENTSQGSSESLKTLPRKLSDRAGRDGAGDSFLAKEEERLAAEGCRLVLRSGALRLKSWLCPQNGGFRLQFSYLA